MKKIILFLLAAAFAGFSNAQTPDWQWARNASGTGLQETILSSTDLSGNVYLAGNFQTDITFGTTTMLQNGLGMYLAKFDPAGNLKWLRIAGGIGSNGVYQVATDADANTYITGRYANTATFGPYTLTNTVATIYHIFIAKYDSSGNILWVRSAGEASNGYDMTWAIHLDEASNIYISGNIQSDTIPLDSDTLYGQDGSFCLIKYDSSGTELWSRSAPCNYFALTQSMTSDNQGNLFLTGYYSGDSLVFPTTTLYHQGPQALNDIFVASYDTSGNFRWAKGYGGNEMDYGYGIAADHGGNVFVTGTFQSSPMIFDAYSIPNVSGQYNYFLAKFNPAGDLLWVKNDSGQSGGYHLVVDAMNDLYWSGRFYSADVTIDTINLQRPALYYDPSFITKVDTAGKVYWARSVASSGDDNNGLSLGLNGDIFFSGDFYGVNPFIIGNDSMPLTGIENAFIAKLGFTSITAAFSSPDHVICPGTCTSFDNLSVNATSFQWLLPGSSMPVSTDINPTNICYNNPGQYDVTLIATGASGTDTLTLHNYVTVYPYPSPQGISQQGDTLFAIQGAVGYQWYYNGIIINGATGYFYVAMASGDYNVVATDGNGCEVEAVVFNVVAGIENVSSELFPGNIFPDPVSDKLQIELPSAIAQSGFEILIYDIFGKRVMKEFSHSTDQVIDVSPWNDGLYILNVLTNDHLYTLKIVKCHSR